MSLASPGTNLRINIIKGENDMQKIKVGEKYPGTYKQEGLFLDYENGFTLKIFLPNISEQEAAAFSSGKYKFGLAELSGILFFISEFKGALDLSDAPFHFGLYDDDRIDNLPTIHDDSLGLSLNIIVVDSATGIIKTLRLIGLGTRFSKRLIEICIRQSQEKIDKIECRKKIAELQNRYNAKELYKFAPIICKG